MSKFVKLNHPSVVSQRVQFEQGDTSLDVSIDECSSISGPPVVLLPSSLRDSLDFHDFAIRLASSGLKVIRPQPRGMGRSRGPLDNLDLFSLARDLAVVIDHFANCRAVVAGHAFGHYVARVAALEHPQRIRGVAVIAGAARELSSDLAKDLDAASDSSVHLLDRLRSLRRAFFAEQSDPRPWLDGWYPELRDIYRKAGKIPEKSKWWPVSNAPILDLQGDVDPWRPPSTRSELKDVLGDKVSIKTISGASHAMIPEQPEAVASALSEWILTLPD